MRTSAWLCGLAFAALTNAAAAQGIGCPPPAGVAPNLLGPPTLHLSADAAVRAPPDELVADLTAFSTASTAITAQRRVNELMAQAGRAAGSATAIKVTFRDYAVQFVDEKPAHWTAQQMLELRGGDSEALLDLAGRLQALGLAIGALDWQVSAEHAEKAHRDGTIAALKSLRAAAAADADALGMEVDHFQSVRVDEEPRPIPLIRGRTNAAAAMAASMPPPQDITAVVSADVVLRPALPERKNP